MDCLTTITALCPLALKRKKKKKIRIVSNEKTRIGSINSFDKVNFFISKELFS